MHLITLVTFLFLCLHIAPSIGSESDKTHKVVLQLKKKEEPAIEARSAGKVEIHVPKEAKLILQPWPSHAKPRGGGFDGSLLPNRGSAEENEEYDPISNARQRTWKLQLVDPDDSRSVEDSREKLTYIRPGSDIFGEDYSDEGDDDNIFPEESNEAFGSKKYVPWTTIVVVRPNPPQPYPVYPHNQPVTMCIDQFNRQFPCIIVQPRPNQPVTTCVDQHKRSFPCIIRPGPGPVKPKPRPTQLPDYDYKG